MMTIKMRKELTGEWQNRGITQEKGYAILTNEMTKAWSGMIVQEYKQLKGLKKENLRDNMTNIELVLNMLAEVTTTAISKQESPKTFEENKKIARSENLMKVLEMIENYKKNCIAQHLEKDYVLGLKYLENNNKIVNNVFNKGMEKEFFDKLFKEKNPWILSDAAFDSFNHHYMLHESLNIIHWCKENADSLNFCDDLELNRKSQLFFKNDSFSMYEENVNFYDEIGDYLYKKYFEYRHMLEMQYRFLCGYSKKNFNEPIIFLLDELNNNQKLNDFYEAVSKRFTLCENYMVALTLNAYYMYNYFDNKEKIIKTLKSVLSYKKITIDLRNLVKKLLIEIESCK